MGNFVDIEIYVKYVIYIFAVIYLFFQCENPFQNGAAFDVFLSYFD